MLIPGAKNYTPSKYAQKYRFKHPNTKNTMYSAGLFRNSPLSNQVEYLWNMKKSNIVCTDESWPRNKMHVIRRQYSYF